jgi:hypothetical protein
MEFRFLALAVECTRNDLEGTGRGAIEELYRNLSGG